MKLFSTSVLALTITLTGATIATACPSQVQASNWEGLKLAQSAGPGSLSHPGPERPVTAPNQRGTTGQGGDGGGSSGSGAGAGGAGAGGAGAGGGAGSGAGAGAGGSGSGAGGAGGGGAGGGGGNR